MKSKDNVNILRRRILGSLATGAIVAGVTVSGSSRAQSIPVKVWKGPTCGCCVDWVTHLEASGFSVAVSDVGNYEARARLGIPGRFGSCHTAEVAGYAIEGHVPAKDIYRLLDEKPDAIGLAVPAMPRGSPGMDGPAYGGIKDPYDVLLIGRDGKVSVFQSYR